MEKIRNLETPSEARILQLAADISPLLDRYGAGFFGGVAVYCYSGGRHPMGDMDILCPEKTIKDLSESVSHYLNSGIQISPFGFDLNYQQGQTSLDIEIMSCQQTQSSLRLPFGITTSLPLEYQWQVVQGKRVLLVSKKLLREMKSKSPRDKDKRDLQILPGH